MKTSLAVLPFGAVIVTSLLALTACAPQPVGFSPTVATADKLAQDGASAPDPSLAITHQFTLRVPSAEAEAIQQRHIAECGKLGCAILNTSIDRSDEGRISAHMSLRIKPEAYDAFAAVLAAPPARITMHVRSAEDLAMPIIDAEKRLGAKTLLRDRFTAMLRDSSVKTAADLVTIEKELAQAQSEIETITVMRDRLRMRTDSVRIDISYFGVAAEVAGLDLSPIRQAVQGVGQTVVRSLSVLISSLAALLPWLPVMALIVWTIRRSIRWWHAWKAPAA